MFDGSLKNAEDIVEGDVLMTPEGKPTTVKKIQTTEVQGEQDLVALGDFYITKGHPIFQDGKNWLFLF